MPVAVPIREALGDDPAPGVVVAAVAEIAVTLAALAAEGWGTGISSRATCSGSATGGSWEMRVMSVEEFRDRDVDYLGWVAAHPDGYVINIGRSRRGYARLHRATCGTITSRPPFTGPYIKICSGALMELDRWALSRIGAVAERCGTCRPLGDAASGQQPGPAEPAASARADSAASPGTPTGQAWEIDGPGDDRRQVWLWDTRYIPYERLTPGQHAARDALRLRVGSLAAATGEIMHASYAGFKPANMDVENLVLCNIDATAGGCFRLAVRHGVRFEVAVGPRRDPPSGRHLACSYQYRLISPGSNLSHWRTVRRLVGFTGADLGRFPSARRLEQVWLAIHHAEAQTAGQPAAPATPFAVFLTLSYPQAQTAGADPELVKALMDGTVAAFQAHGNHGTVAEIATRLAVATGRPAVLIAQTLLNDRRAVLGITGMLVHLRGTGVQWNPADHLCMAGQVLCRQAPGGTWALSGEIHAVEQEYQAA